MAELPQQPLPPVVGECVTTMQLAQPGPLPEHCIAKMVRSADGKIRCDCGNTSVITDLAAQRTTLLDHVKKEARVITMPQVPAGQFDPTGLGTAAPQPPALKNVEDLGKSIMEGLEVVGKRYTFQPPPGPQRPGLPAAPVISEVWTSTKLQLPVLTKTTGEFGEQIRRCKYSEAAAPPPPTLFQIPEGYKMVATPAAPKPPGLPR